MTITVDDGEDLKVGDGTPLWGEKRRRWKPAFSVGIGRIYIYPLSDITSDGKVWETVSPPNWIERRFGITYEKKASRALKRVQARCDQLNQAIDLLESREMQVVQNVMAAQSKK